MKTALMVNECRNSILMTRHPVPRSALCKFPTRHDQSGALPRSGKSSVWLNAKLFSCKKLWVTFKKFWWWRIFLCKTLLSYPATFLVYHTKLMAWSGTNPLYKRNISRAVSVLTLDWLLVFWRAVLYFSTSSRARFNLQDKNWRGVVVLGMVIIVSIWIVNSLYLI